MNNILDGLIGAFDLLFSFDREIYRIIGLSLIVAFSSTAISALLGIPAGVLIGMNSFKGKKLLVRLIYTLMSLPPVIAGLVIFLLLSRKGPLGFMGILFTPAAMIIAQVSLITPIITGIVYNSVKEKGQLIRSVGKTLGAGRIEILLLLVAELRVSILTGVITGFGRATSEVGAIMLVGGNIKGHTRVMTTTIAMLQGMGEYTTAIALGFVLLTISFIINSLLYKYQRVE
ncbi:MAG: ABC transporter permease [Bacillota bacterium]